MGPPGEPAHGGDGATAGEDATVALVQARFGSSRLPGKVLADLAGRTVLESVLARLSRARTLTRTVLATSIHASDDAVAEVGARAGVQVVRGSLEDALDRFRLAAEETEAGVVVRITADCPLIDPTVVDAVVSHARATGADYATNTLPPRSFPDGLDVEVITRRALLTAAREATELGDREHVTSWIRARPERFPSAGLRLVPAHADLRITLDTAEDLRRLREIAVAAGRDALLPDILRTLGRDPGTRIEVEP